MNKCVFLGNLTRDPEVKSTTSGKTVTSFSLAVRRPFVENETDFFDFECWNGRGERIAEYFKKGDELLIECHARQDTWEQDDQKRSKVKFVVDSFYFTNGRKSKAADTADEKPAKKAKPAGRAKKVTVETGDESDDEVPF